VLDGLAPRALHASVHTGDRPFARPTAEVDANVLLFRDNMACNMRVPVQQGRWVLWNSSPGNTENRLAFLLFANRPQFSISKINARHISFLEIIFHPEIDFPLVRQRFICKGSIQHIR